MEMRIGRLGAVDPSDLLDEVLANPVYRGSSRAPQKVMAKEKRSLLRGGHLLEQALGVTKTKTVHQSQT